MSGQKEVFFNLFMTVIEDSAENVKLPKYTISDSRTKDGNLITDILFFQARLGEFYHLCGVFGVFCLFKLTKNQLLITIDTQ